MPVSNAGGAVLGHIALERIRRGGCSKLGVAGIILAVWDIDLPAYTQQREEQHRRVVAQGQKSSRRVVGYQPTLPEQKPGDDENVQPGDLPGLLQYWPKANKQ